MPDPVAPNPVVPQGFWLQMATAALQDTVQGNNQGSDIGFATALLKQAVGKGSAIVDPAKFQNAVDA